MSNHYPKVLMVGAGFNQITGTGITLSNLFQGWPAENLAVLHNSPYENDTQRAMEFRLEMELALPLLQRGIAWKTRAEIQSAATQNAEARIGGSRPVSVRGLAKKTFESLGITGLVRRFPLNLGLQDFVAKFRPDVCYTLLGDIPVASLFEGLLDQFPLPSVVHIMDDYPATLYREGLCSGIVRSQMHRQLRRIFSRATICLGIGHAMCDEYRVRYGRDFLPFHNPVDLGVWWGAVANRQHRDGTCFTMVYSGRIGTSCLSSIREVCRVIETWSNRQISLVFKILVNDRSQAFETAPFLKHCHPNIRVEEAPRSAEEVVSLLAGADLLLYPVDFERESVDYIKLSMPTKVPAYMATGVPILVYGPPEVASVRYALDQGWGLVVDRQSPEVLEEAIVRLCTDRALRIDLCHRAQKLVEENFEAHLVCNRFREMFVSATARHSSHNG